MNPLTNVKNITKLNEIELSKGTTDKKSWHDVYKSSAWIFIGGLAYGLTEGDVLAVFSQYGEIVNINLVRDKKTGKTKGFCFLCYANQKSTVLAVDNLNAIKLLNRTIRVDHVLNYKPPKDNEQDDEVTKQLKSEGCAPKPIKQETSPVHAASSSKKKKSKKEKKKRKKDKKEADEKPLLKKSKIKKEKHDPGYDKYELPQNSEVTSTVANTAKKNRTSDSESSTAESSDENDVNAKKLSKERDLNERIHKTQNRAVANDFAGYKKGDSKYSSNQKRNLSHSESDSEDDYVKKKKSKASHSEDENTISSNVRYSKHKSKRRHSSDSSECSSPNDDRRRNFGKVPSYEQRNTSLSSSAKNTHILEDRKKETVRHHRSSSSTEDVAESNSRYNKSRKRDSMKHSRSESSHCKEYHRSAHRNIEDPSDLRNDRDRSNREFSSDRRNIAYRKSTDDKSGGKNNNNRWSNDAKSSHMDYDAKSSHMDYDEQSHSKKYSDKNDQEYNVDRGNIDNRTNRRNKDVKGDGRNNSDSWSSDGKSSRVSYDEQSHPRKYSDQNDRKNCDFRKSTENSNRNSFQYSNSVKNVKSFSAEREAKHSKHRDRDDTRKDWYEKRNR